MKRCRGKKGRGERKRGEGWEGEGWGGRGGEEWEERREKEELNVSLILPGRQMFERDASLALSDARFLTESKRSYLPY